MSYPWRVLVGVDGGDGARAALWWAVREADRRGGLVHAVAAYHRAGRRSAGPPADPYRERDNAEDLLLHAVGELPGHRGVAISTQAVEGDLGDVLVALSGTADLLVVGSEQVRLRAEGPSRAACPVVVVPAPVLDGLRVRLAARSRTPSAALP